MPRVLRYELDMSTTVKEQRDGIFHKGILLLPSQNFNYADTLPRFLEVVNFFPELFFSGRVCICVTASIH